MVATTGLLSLPLSSQAQTIVGVQFGPYNLLNGVNYTAQNLTAGIDAYDVNNWNSYQPAGGSSGTYSLSGGTPNSDPALINSTGASTGIGFSVNFTRADNTGSTGTGMAQTPYYESTGPGQQFLAGNGITVDGSPMTINLSGLSTTDSYTLVAYVSGLFYGGLEASWSLGSQTFYVDNTNNNALGSWVQGTATSAGSATAANYVEFDNITAPTGTLSFTGTGIDGGQPGLMGFQLIDDGSSAVPEPSTWAMLFGGLGSLVALQRIRRRSQA